MLLFPYHDGLPGADDAVWQGVADCAKPDIEVPAQLSYALLEIGSEINKAVFYLQERLKVFGLFDLLLLCSTLRHYFQRKKRGSNR